MDRLRDLVPVDVREVHELPGDAVGHLLEGLVLGGACLGRLRLRGLGRLRLRGLGLRLRGRASVPAVQLVDDLLDLRAVVRSQVADLLLVVRLDVLVVLVVLLDEVLVLLRVVDVPVGAVPRERTLEELGAPVVELAAEVLVVPVVELPEDALVVPQGVVENVVVSSEEAAYKSGHRSCFLSVCNRESEDGLKYKSACERATWAVRLSFLFLFVFYLKF